MILPFIKHQDMSKIFREEPPSEQHSESEDSHDEALILFTPLVLCGLFPVFL
jgi:hypothetical protein